MIIFISPSLTASLPIYLSFYKSARMHIHAYVHMHIYIRIYFSLSHLPRIFSKDQDSIVRSITSPAPRIYYRYAMRPSPRPKLLILCLQRYSEPRKPVLLLLLHFNHEGSSAVCVYTYVVTLFTKKTHRCVL